MAEDELRPLLPHAQQMTQHSSSLLRARRKTEGGSVARETTEAVAREMRHHQEPRLPAGGTVGVGRGLAQLLWL